jgi:hypothetical protein
MACEHSRKEFRRFKYEQGGKIKYHKACQCLDCGQRIKSMNGGVWWPAEDDENIGRLPDFDLVLLDKCNREEQSKKVLAYREEITIQKRLFHERHEEVLQSAEWQKRRELIFKRCNNVCECCLNAPATQVHHENYDTLGSEIMWHLRGVCRDCHMRIHGLIK